MSSDGNARCKRSQNALWWDRYPIWLTTYVLHVARLASWSRPAYWDPIAIRTAHPDNQDATRFDVYRRGSAAPLSVPSLSDWRGLCDLWSSRCLLRMNLCSPSSQLSGWREYDCSRSIHTSSKSVLAIMDFLRGSSTTALFFFWHGWHCVFASVCVVCVAALCVSVFEAPYKERVSDYLSVIVAFHSLQTSL